MVNKQRVFIALALLIISFVAYLPSLKSEFVWDDVESIENSYHYFEASGVLKLIIPDEVEKKEALYYRPVIYASYVLDKSLWGGSPFGFHLSNLLFNSICVLLVFVLVLCLGIEFGSDRTDRIAFLSALLFALTPLHVESVSWISARTDLLCAVFLVIAFISHLYLQRKPYFLVLATLSFALALLSKEVAVSFLLIVLVYDIITAQFYKRFNLIAYTLYAGILFVYIYVRGRAFVNMPEFTVDRVGGGDALEGAGGFFAGILSPEIIKTFLESYSYYIYKLFFPFDLNAFITGPPSQSIYLVVSVFLLLLFVVLALFALWRRYYLVAFAVLWALITLGPSVLVSVLDVASAPIAERYMYIPSIGMSLFLGSMCITVGRFLNMRRFGMLMGIFLSLAYFVITVDRQAVWTNRLALWEDTATKSPHHAIPLINYGMALLDEGRVDEALVALKDTFKPVVTNTDGGRAIAANNIGVVYINKGELDQAEDWFYAALEYDSNYHKTHYHLGLVNYSRGLSNNSHNNLLIAKQYLERAVELNPSYGIAYFLLAKVYFELGDNEQAARYAAESMHRGLKPAIYKKAETLLDKTKK